MEISQLCLVYIDDHFMLNQETFVWTIKGKDLDTFLNASMGDSMDSDTFYVGSSMESEMFTKWT